LNLQNMMKRCKLPTNVIFKIFLSWNQWTIALIIEISSTPDSIKLDKNVIFDEVAHLDSFKIVNFLLFWWVRWPKNWRNNFLLSFDRD
jgi:hypothetical protein